MLGGATGGMYERQVLPTNLQTKVTKFLEKNQD